MRPFFVGLLAAAATGCGLSLAGDAPPGGGDDASGPAADATAGADAQDAGQDHGSNDAPTDTSTDAPTAEASGDGSTATMDAVDDIAPPEGGSEAGPLNAYSLEFDGSQTFVGCANVPIPTDFTIEAWVNPASFNNETYVAAEDKAFQPQGQFRFGFVDTGQLFFVMSDAQSNMYGLQANTSAPYNLISNDPLPTGTWSEVAVSKSGGSFTLLVGGLVVSTVNTTSFAFGNGGAQNPFRIGARVDQDGVSPDGVFDGLIDEVRFWNVGRTAGQIAADMRNEITSSDPGWSTLQDYWRFDEGKGTKAKDVTGSFDGTLVNGPLWDTSTPF